MLTLLKRHYPDLAPLVGVTMSALAQMSAGVPYTRNHLPPR